MLNEREQDARFASTARAENHATYDEILDGRKAIEQGQPRASGKPERARVIREQSDEAIGKRDAACTIDAATCAIRFEHCSTVESMALDLPRELPCIAEA